MAATRLFLIFGIAGAMVAGAAIHEVKTAVTEEDRAYGTRILERAGYSLSDAAADIHEDFDSQITAILAVQDAVLQATPVGEELPHGRPREPKDLLETGQGLCSDRSRAIEKILGMLGFETRHVAVYWTETYSRIRAFITPGTQSHALTEARTTKGWIAVGSNSRWIGLTADKTVHSIEEIQAHDPFQTEWAAIVPEQVSWQLFSGSFTYVIGLYSRHGGFFPPYDPVPDVNYSELLQNFF